MGTILVTGGAGFIGSHICRALCKQGRDVVSIDDLSGGVDNHEVVLSELVVAEHPVGNFEYYEFDCADRDAVRNVVKSHGVTTLVHCAANAREGASQFQPVSVTHRNLWAYVNTLTECVSAGVQSVVLFSSMAVYGHGTRKPPFDEDQQLDPTDVYAFNKASMEGITRVLSGVHGFNTVIVRPHNCFGMEQSTQDRFRNAVAIFMNLVLRKEPITVYGDGEQTRAFSYIADCLPVFIHTILHVDKLNGHIFNIGGMIPITVNMLVHEVLCAMGENPRDYPIEYLPDRPCEVKHAFPTYDKSVDLLGYTETVGWQRGVREMAAWITQLGPRAWVNNEPIELFADSLPKTWIGQ